MLKRLIGTTAVALTIVVALSASAEARCWWHGYGWVCAYPPPYAAVPVYPPVYAAPRRYYDPSGMGPYQGRDFSYGHWGAASHLGPDPGGGFYHMGRSNVGHTD